MTGGRWLGVLVGTSAVVTALCAVAVTATVLTSNVSVKQQRTFDREDLAARVVHKAIGHGDISSAGGTPTCPSGVLIEEGVSFTCQMSMTVAGRSDSWRVRFRVTNAAGADFEFVEVLQPSR